MFFKNKKLSKHCSVYFSDKHNQIIITARHINNAGILFEQQNCKTTSISISAQELGTLVIESMNLFSINDVDLRDRKMSDWPPFKHSKSKSVREFEKEYFHISVDSVNEYNLIIEINGSASKDSDLIVKSTVSFNDSKEEIGKKIMQVYNVCLTRKI